MARLGLILAVTALGGFRRRAGITFPTSVTELNWQEIGHDQFEQLIEDPQLLCEARFTREMDGREETIPVALRPPFADAWPIIVELEQNYLKFREAEGAEDGIGAGMSAPDGSEAKVGDGTDAAPAADPPGAPSTAAVEGEESREGTNTGSGVATPPVDGGKEPESSLKAPVAAPASEGAADEKGAPAPKPANSRKPKTQPADKAD